MDNKYVVREHRSEVFGFFAPCSLDVLLSLLTSASAFFH